MSSTAAAIPPVRWPHRRSVFPLALLALAACDPKTGAGPVDPGDGDKPVAQVAVSPGAVQLLPGDTVRLEASAKAADGSVVSGRPVTWQSFTPSVATVSSSGLVTALDAGSAVVRASVDGVYGEATATVTALNPVPTVTALSPDTVETGTSVAVVTITGAGFTPTAVVLWDGAPRAATYVGETELRLVLGPSDLLVPGLRAIAVQNPAPGGGTSSTLPLTIQVGVSSVVVSPDRLQLLVGDSAQLQARALDQHGAEIDGRTFTWTSSNPGAVSVGPTGLVAAKNPGPAIITVTTGSRSAQVEVTALARVQTIWVTPLTPAVLVGNSVQLGARTFTTGMIEVTGRAVRWTSEDPSTATVDTSGRVIGVSKGTTRIRAECEGAVASVPVEVRQWSQPVATLDLRGFVETLVWPDVDTTTWVDGQNTAHPAVKALLGGALHLHFDTWRWERTYDIRIYSGGMEVGQEVWIDQGDFGYLFGGGGYWLTSDVSGQTVQAYDQFQGELQIHQGVGTSPPLTQMWVVR